jgi:hypothetical protein
VPEIGDSISDCAKDFKGRHDLAGGEHGDVDSAVRQCAHALGDALGRHARTRQPLRP